MARQAVDQYIPFFGRDFYTSTATWTPEEVGHYIRLLVIQWDAGALPDSLDRLERISPGVSAVWDLLATKFPVCEDGQRRNARMEEHRGKAEELHEARSQAGKNGARNRWANGKPMANGCQTDGKPMAKPMANGMAKGWPPSPSPSSTHTHTPAGIEHDERPDTVNGWAADEWASFAASWNATERAEPWRHLTAPDGWADRAAAPGWLQRAKAALAMLPSRAYFDRPLPITRFFDYVDRILAGEFGEPKRHPVAAGVAKAPRRGNL